MINVNVIEEIYEKFKKICKDDDSSAAVEIRKYMKRVVKEHEEKDKK